MNRAILFAAAAAAALSIAACSRQDSSNPGQSEPVNAAQDAVGAAVGATSAATAGSFSTDAFTSNAAESDVYEIEAGKMAQQRAKNADVKAFGQMMVADHTAMSNEMKPLIQAAGQQIPDKLDERRQGLLDNLKAASDADFDKTYIDQQVAAHKEALTLMQGYADHGDNAQLKAAAAKAAPKIQQHLDRAQQLQSQLGG